MIRPLTHQELLETIHYSSETGQFIWKKRTANCCRIGSRAGGVDQSNGYYKITILGRKSKGHRLAWFYMTGENPKEMVDHINGIKHDNRFENLRLATRSQNIMNSKISKKSKSGIKGVRWVPSARKWQTSLMKDGKHYYFGSFKRLEDAATAVIKGRNELHGAFAKHQ